MEVLEGVVVFLKYSEGTKSESRRPFLYLGRNSDPIRLWKKEDNPFENNMLHEFDGKHVIISGKLNREVFEIEEINLKGNGGADNG